MSKNNVKALYNLEQKIVASRRRLMDLWDIRGFTDADVLAASIELDDLLNLYQHSNLKNNRIYKQ